jgi:hypothetical protein
MPSPEQKAAEKIADYVMCRPTIRRVFVPHVAAIIAEHLPNYDEMREALGEITKEAERLLGNEVSGIGFSWHPTMKGYTAGLQRAAAIARGGLGED